MGWAEEEVRRSSSDDGEALERALRLDEHMTALPTSASPESNEKCEIHAPTVVECPKVLVNFISAACSM